MIYFGFNEALKRWKRIIITSILFALIMVLTFMSVSTYEAQSKKYDGFREILNKPGFFVFINPMNLLGDVDGDFEEGLKKELIKVDGIYYPLKNSVLVEGKEEWGYVSVYGYDKHYADYKPAVESGCWFTDAPKKDGLINVVVTKCEGGYKVGDKITIIDSEMNYIEAYVCGVLENKASFYEPGRTDLNNDIYSLYETYDIYNSDNQYDEDLRSNPNFKRFIFMSKDDLSSSLGGICLGTMFITFDKDVSRNVLEKNEQTLRTKAEFVVANSVMKTNSDAVLMNKVLVLIPLTVCGFIMILLSFIVTSVLEAYEDRKKFTILYMTGAKVENSFYIRMVELVITIILSISLTVTIKKIIISNGLKNTILFNISSAGIFLVVIEIAVIFIISSIIPLLIIKKKSLIHTLRSSKL